MAFDLPSATGFHIIRAVEAVIRKYYSVIVKQPVKPKMRNWGTYIRVLSKSGGDPKILAILDQLREMHRNPIMHPQVVLTMTEAEGLFGIAQSAILSMMADIEKHQQLPLPAVP